MPDSAVSLPLLFASLALHSVAGFLLFRYLLNRHLFGIPDTFPGKHRIILATLLLCMGIPATIGFLYPGTPWIYLALGVILTFLWLEGVVSYLHRAWSASPPLDTIPHRVPLTSPITTTDLVTHRYTIRLPRAVGRPLRIAHLSDLHANPGQSTAYYEEVFRTVEALEPDLFFLTGDFVTARDGLPILSKVLRRCGRYGGFAVLGNHDIWCDPEAVTAALADAGIEVLTNAWRPVPVDGGTVHLAGCGRPWGETLATPVADDSTAPRMVLSHTPDNIFRLAKLGADCVFAGHCHAGHFRLPWLGAVVTPSIYGRLFDHGHYKIHDTHLFVTSGIGTVRPPVRLYCQPDIFLVEME